MKFQFSRSHVWQIGIGLTLLALLTSFAVAQTRTLTVRGSGEVHVAPDRATVRLGLTHQAESAAEAQNEVNRVAGRILEAIRGMGIPEESIRTVDLNLHAIYASMRQPEDQPRIVGYRASNVVEVRTDDLDRVGPIIDAGLQAGANRVEGVQFGLANDEPARREALRRAADDARRKAEALAEALEVRLLEIDEISEEGVTFPVREVYQQRTMAMDAATPVSPGQLSVNAGVSLKYSISRR